MNHRLISYRSILYRLSHLPRLSHKKVDFIITGVQKAGTSALREYLLRHPQINMSYSKEAHFFSRPNFSHSRISHWWYEKDFDQSDHDKTFGEVTPMISYFIPSISRIASYHPDMKLITILRNPIERAYSHWNMEVDRGNERATFSEAIRRTKVEQDMYKSYVDRGYYMPQILRQLKHFPSDQLLFIKYEDYRDDQETTIREILRFLALSQGQYQHRKIISHQRPYPCQLLPQDREYLKQLYKTDIHQVEKQLGWDCSDWL